MAMSKLGRRALLGRLGMGAVAAPMLPAAITDAVARGGGMRAVGSLVTTASSSVETPPWVRAGLSEAVWRGLRRQRWEAEAREGFRRLAGLGVIDGDIQALGSLSHNAKVRMQVRREVEARRENAAWSERLFGVDF